MVNPSESEGVSLRAVLWESHLGYVMRISLKHTTISIIQFE